MALPDIVHGVCHLLEARLQRRGMAVQTAALASAPTVLADRTLLRQAPVSYTHLDVYKRQAIKPVTSWKKSTGVIIGSVIFHSRVQLDAPSTCAAS